MGSENNKNEINGIRGVRLRVGRTGHVNFLEESTTPEPLPKSDRPLKPFASQTIPQSFLVIVYLCYGALFCGQIYLERYHHLNPLMIKDIRSNPDKFIAERAMIRLTKLTDIGPRVAGSYENEVLAVEFLTKEIIKIIEEANRIHSIEMDVRKFSGSFPLRFLDGLTNVYKNVQDVIVRLGPRKHSSHSLLMNCHFDSVTDSPGGSDDGAGCAILLEILDVLSKSNSQLEHNIIFLFNGAEENLMHGSHGFITQHKWANEVRAFVNLEACGAGGREVLFQSGPNSPWIMEVYAKSVLHPFASSMAQEVFESGLIPGDTDFRVFRDFGNVSGLDFAWSSNGYVYHTKYDNVDQIPLGVLQRSGENMLALAKGLANAKEMKDVSKYREGNMIYFDILGLYLVRWPENVGTIINVSTVVLSLILLCVSVLDSKRKDITPQTYLLYMFKTFGVVLLGAVCSIAVVLSISGFLALVGKSMSWYGRPVWVLFLYIIPSVMAVMAVQQHFSLKFLRVIPSRMVLFQLYYDVYQLIWTAILMGTVMLKIRSGYVAWMWVIGPCLGILIHRMFKSPLLRGPDWKWLSFLLISVSLPVIQHINMQVGCLSLFIPIMGRSGASLNSEIVISMFVNITFGMLFAYIAPIIIMVAHPKKTLASLSLMFLISFALLLLTPIGFPYSGDKHSPRPQRFMILHTERLFHDRLGKEAGSGSGYWIVDHDYNSPHSVQAFVPEISHAVPLDKDCDRYLYCGLPYLMPVLSFLRKTHWIPSTPPKIEKPTVLKVISRNVTGDHLERLYLEITGPDHMGLIISPKPNVEFVRWSLNEEGPVKGPNWNEQETYFVYYASSSDPEPWNLFLEFKVQFYNETLMDLALTSHILHGPRKSQASFKRMLAQFPSWTTVTSWTATYKKKNFYKWLTRQSFDLKDFRPVAMEKERGKMVTSITKSYSFGYINRINEYNKFGRVKF